MDGPQAASNRNINVDALDAVGASAPAAQVDGTKVARMAVRCNLCGSDQTQLLFEGVDRQLGHPGRFPIVKCKQCGLIYQSPRPVDMGPFYQGGYASHHDDTGIAGGAEPQVQPLLYRLGLKRGPHVGGRAGLYYEVFKQAAPPSAPEGAPSGSKLLDVGCADGAFIAAMDRIGYDVAGVEPDADTAALANRRLSHLGRMAVTTGTLELAQLAPNSFDIITLWHAIEHVDDPLATLTEAHRLLKPGGICLIQTPKAESLESRVFGPYWAGWECPRHLWLFTAKTLAAIGRKAGFTSVKALSGTSYGIFTLSLKFWLAEITSAATAEGVYQALSRPLPDRLLYWLFKPGDALGIGSQLTLCFTKSA